MAFLAKKVPKIFPSSKTNKGPNHHDHHDFLSSRQTCNRGKNKNTFLFRKKPRENERRTENPSKTNYHHHQQQHHQQHQQQQTPVAEKNKMHNVLLDTGETFDCCGESNKNIQNNCFSDGNSNASTLESSPTPIPRETMDPNILVLPDLPTLEFPSPESTHDENNSNNNIINNIINNQNNQSNDITKTTALPSSLRLAPRTISHHDDSNDFPPPPVALVTFPMEFAFLPPPPPPLTTTTNTNTNMVASCLTRPPPRAGEWDDATIESHELLDDQVETNQKFTFEQQQRQRETTTAQASVIMKPWIERAARLALLQNRACGNFRDHHQSSTITTSSATRIGADERFAPLLRQRRREATLLNLRPKPEGGHNPRALLATLEKGQQKQKTTATSTSDCIQIHQQQQQQKQKQRQEDLPQTPRIVKWHVVRDTRK